jgi:hypothetical protein
MNSVFNPLKLRIVPIPYTSPPICEADFTGADFGEIILPPLESDGIPGLVWEVVGEGWRFRWDAVPGAICYSVFRNNGDGTYTTVADCIETLYWNGTEDGCYRVDALTPEGTVEGVEVCIDGYSVSFNGLVIPPFTLPRGRFGAVSPYAFVGPAWVSTGTSPISRPTWSVRLPEDWPTGMTFQRNTGGFAGTPVRDPGIGEDELYVGTSTFRATSGQYWAERYFINWTIDPQIRITSGPEISTNGPGEEFVVTLVATNVKGDQTWTTSEPPESWPEWFNLSSSGQLTVIPPDEDPYTFTAVVTDTGEPNGLPSRGEREITLVAACAGEEVFTGTTAGGETWHRVNDNGSQPPFYMSLASSAVPYAVHTFVPTCTAEYTINVEGSFDTYLVVYANVFDADKPLCGDIPMGAPGCYAVDSSFDPPIPMCENTNGGVCLRANDDFEDASHSQIVMELVQGQTYHFVVTGFEDAEAGAYTLTVSWG